MWWSETLHSLARFRWSARPGARGYVAIAGASLLAACGFQLRGEAVIPFRDLYITAAAGSPIAADLTRKLQATNTRLAASAAVADARLAIVDELREKIILSLSGAGRVRDAKGAVLIEKSEINLTRIMSYDDAFVLAKQQEEALLYHDMQNDVVQQILRRLSQVKRAG